LNRVLIDIKPKQMQPFLALPNANVGLRSLAAAHRSRPYGLTPLEGHAAVGYLL
jgi:hypothetical protein